MRYPFGILWIAFAVLWIFWPQHLGYVYDWLVGLPLILEIILWIVFLPWVGSLFIWHSGLALWLKILLVAVIAVATIGGLGGRKAARRRGGAWGRSTNT